MHKLPAPLSWKSPAALVATFGGSGLLTPASGTWGSLAALPPGLLIAWQFGPQGLITAALVAYALGHWACQVWLSHADDKDPSAIVIDEAVGLWLALTTAPLTVPGIALAFGLFRLFDIVKPWPVGWADTKLSGPAGIMLDDVLAGLWAALLLLAAAVFGLI